MTRFGAIFDGHIGHRALHAVPEEDDAFEDHKRHGVRQYGRRYSGDPAIQYEYSADGHREVDRGVCPPHPHTLLPCYDNPMEFTREELTEARRALTSLVSKCEKVQLKLAEGTPQHALTKNRLKAFYLSLTLIERELGASDQE